MQLWRSSPLVTRSMIPKQIRSIVRRPFPRKRGPVQADPLPRKRVLIFGTIPVGLVLSVVMVLGLIGIWSGPGAQPVYASTLVVESFNVFDLFSNGAAYSTSRQCGGTIIVPITMLRIEGLAIRWRDD